MRIHQLRRDGEIRYKTSEVIKVIKDAGLTAHPRIKYSEADVAKIRTELSKLSK